MTDAILKYYHQQLDYLREAGNSFSKKHPKTAGLLKLDQQGSSDPFVERILESFAFLSAKIQANHEEDKNFLAQSLLDLLYPMATLPLPSMTTVQFKSDVDCDRLTVLPKNTQLESSPEMTKKCFFRTGYDLDLMPLDLNHQSILPIVDLPSGIIGPSHAKAFVLLQFSVTSDVFKADEVPDRPLRIYVKAFKQYAKALTAYLLQHQICCVVQASSKESVATIRFDKPLQPVGFGQKDLLIPSEKSGYEDCQVFTEFAAYPQKHDYISFVDYHSATRGLDTLNFDCYLLLDHYDVSMVSFMDKAQLCLGCVPVINLFDSHATPILMDQQKSTYPLQSMLPIPKDEVEIYKVTHCRVFDNDDSELTAKPIYQTSFTDRSNAQAIYWHSHKKSCWELGHPELVGTESMISINVPSDSPGKKYVHAQLLCTSRDAVLFANFCQKIDELVISGRKEKDCSIEMLYHPCAPIRSVDINSMNHMLSILEGSHRELFSLKDPYANAENFKYLCKALNRSNQEDLSYLIDQVQSIQANRTTVRYPIKNQLIYISGIEVVIVVAVDLAQEGTLYFFGCAINALCKHYCPINSSISISISNQTTRKVMTWPAQFL
jgi:type VI secretion system protein ImpG